jgi:hypothetical protein
MAAMIEKFLRHWQLGGLILAHFLQFLSLQHTVLNHRSA